jgi:hypothetical protein
MGKRSDFLRNARDVYDTPEAAVLPLLPHLMPCTRFIEPAAGAGALLTRVGHVPTAAYDIEPRSNFVQRKNMLGITREDLNGASCCITNPPWSRVLLHALILHLRTLDIPAWLLVDANWMFTRQAIPYLKYCRTIATVGRVKWIPGTKMTGKDDAAWFLFLPRPTKTTFFGKMEKTT